MAWIRPSKPDPISERSRALSSEIAALEAQIRDLGARLETHQADAVEAADPVPPVAAVSQEPVFEPVNRLASAEETPAPTVGGHFNDLGVRKYDLAAAWQRLQRHFRGPAASNPRLIHYLAAGSIQGLRPLRYEARVARNRVIALSLVLLFVLWGLIALFRGH